MTPSVRQVVVMGRRFTPLSLFSNGEPGDWWDFSRTDLLFQNSNGTTAVAADTDPVGYAMGRRGSLTATQSTAGQRPLWRTGGVIRGDASDDSLLTTLAAGTTHTYAGKIKPSGAGRAAIGAVTGAADRAYLAISSAGQAAGGCGTDGLDNITAGSSILTTIAVTVVTWDGSTVKLYLNGTLIYNQPQNGTPNTANAARLGAANNGGALVPFGGDIYQLLSLKGRAITQAEVTQLTNYWGLT